MRSDEITKKQPLKTVYSRHKIAAICGFWEIAHLLSALKEKSNGAIDCQNWTRNREVSLLVWRPLFEGLN